MNDLARPLIIGHRGASGYRPEHTRSAYELAFELGADAVEPDIVASKDGVLVVRHENEISGTTDVAEHPEFADRRTTKVIDGETLDGWFTEDFTWAELATLSAKERLPDVRPGNVEFDRAEGILRLRDVLNIVDAADQSAHRQCGIVIEVKHAQYFESIGLALDALLEAELNAAGWNNADPRLVIESFEPTVLAQLKSRGVQAKYIFLIDREGAPADLIAAHGAQAPAYASFLTEPGLAALVGTVDGISVDKQLIIPRSLVGETSVASDLVTRAHAHGLEVYCWTLRPENTFLGRNHRIGKARSDHGKWHDEFAIVMATGIDGVFADQPDLAAQVRSGLPGYQGYDI